MPEPIFEAAAILGARIRARRQELKLSQEQLDGRTGVHWSYLGQVERGLRNPSLRNLLRLADGLEIDLAELVRELPAPPADEGENGPERRPRRV
ncbi:XRE family transcriptional regulator [Amycolatopsis sp. WAC 04197]|uniref:helix-turn-helix domain-containing protein n=1 Tax=Amycolatopsis sp. WAC 04197 TaxID=2203199 RepID=UPI000F78927C|nr:helix-turn-helix transcriptional regulator [Amycolatopsis sp. WAC 04197]RSN40050.1 XRE family transcriptional regulator [Amycolatopsis sp. WAC 04197]